MFSLLLTTAVFAAPDWPTEWLGEVGSGFIEFEYRVTDICEIELVSFRAEPTGLSQEEAVGYLKRNIVSNKKSVDLDKVFGAVPGVDKEDALNLRQALTEDQFLAIDKAVKELGPWPGTRIIRVDGKLLVCEFDPHGKLVRTSFFGEEDAPPLSSLPLQEIRINFEYE